MSAQELYEVLMAGFNAARGKNELLAEILHAMAQKVAEIAKRGE